MISQANWIPTRIEELKALDIVMFKRSVWVIHRISRNSDRTLFHVTEVSSGTQSTWTFLPHSHGYLIEKRFEING